MKKPTIKITKNSYDEYRVTPNVGSKRQQEMNAYYTESWDDAVCTARVMATSLGWVPGSWDIRVTKARGE